MIRLVGAGWGHGAGMCQIGALGMALVGYDYPTILHHYFERMTLQRVYA
jgi:SpoIID/LytB domain protein